MQNQPENLKNVMPAPPYPPPYGWYQVPYGGEEEVSLLDYFRVIKKHIGKIILITLLLTGIGTAACFWITKKYQAEVAIMPLTQSSGGGGLAALASQFSSIPMVGGQLSGLAGLAGGSQKSGQIMSILKSRTFIENIINQFDLMKTSLYKGRWDAQKNEWKPDYFGKTPVMEDAVKKFRKKVLSVEDDKKTSLIKIDVELSDPELAAKVANRIIVELQDFISHNQLTVAKRNRVFIEEQLQKNKMDLLESGKKLNQFYSNNRVSSVQPQMDVNIGKIEGPPKTFEEFRTELSGLNSKGDELASQLTEEEKKGVVHGVPSQVYLQYLTLQRELLGRVNGLLTQQYELAKIEEAKEDLTFQVIDKAVTPVRPSWPKKSIIIPLSFFGALFTAVFFAFFLEYLRKLKETEKKRQIA
ncbi:MAG: Wzz/FepE/Etk N-terminal domain-containing protein [bacterium]